MNRQLEQLVLLDVMFHVETHFTDSHLPYLSWGCVNTILLFLLTSTIVTKEVKKKSTFLKMFTFLILTNIYWTSGLEIHPKTCQNELGEKGTCMFVWECVKIDGVHLSHCFDKYLIRSCCGSAIPANDLETSKTSPLVSNKPTTAVSNIEFVTTKRPIAVTVTPRPSSINTTVILHGLTSDGTPSNTSVPAPVDHIKDCGIPPLFPKRKIVGGKKTAFGAWPWQVSVRKSSFFGLSSTHRCGGAVLSKEWIVTAGHCVHDLRVPQIRIRVGEYDFSSVLEPFPFVERRAKKKVVHPKYNFFTYENDLALVKLNEPVEFKPHIAPICLPDDNDNLVGHNATITGWGRLSEGGVLPSMMQELQMPIVSNQNCTNMFLAAGRREYIPDIFMCAGFEDGGKDSCQGDSGGPIQVQREDGRWFLAGIISWGIGCGEPNLPGVSTRISKFKDWILENIRK